MDLSQYRDLFVTEAREHLDALNNALLDLEANPDDEDALGETFRSAHTIKGMAATMGYDALTAASHELENLLDLLRNRTLRVNRMIMDVLYRSVDALGVAVEKIERGEAVSEEDDAVRELIAMLRRAVELEETLAMQETTDLGQRDEPSWPRPGRTEAVSLEGLEAFGIEPKDVLKYISIPGTRIMHVTVTLDSECTLKSVRVFMIFKKLAQAGDVMVSRPTVEELEDERFERSFEVILASQKMPEAVRASLLEVAEVSDVRVYTLLEPHVLSEFGTSGGVSEEEREPKSGEVRRRLSSLRVNIEKLDRLMSLVGEIIINRSRLENIAARSELPELKEALGQTARLTTEMQDEIMQMRMVPVEHVLNRFPRMVRDLSNKQGKQVRFLIEGKDIELDRTVLEEISEPLMHLLRNAIHHGIEKPEERELLDKPSMATIRVSAFRDRNYVAIRVEDDGRGIKPGEIFDRAVRKGLISSEERDSLTDADLLRVLCMPGFSTEEEADTVSGRGVGLDAVKNKVEKLGGSMSVDTVPGLGTSVTLRLPLTLAIIRALLVEVSGEVYALPLGFVDEVRSVLPEEVKSVQGGKIILSRGSPIPLLRLDSLLSCRKEADGHEPFSAVVIEYGRRRVAIAVHALLGQQEIVITPLDSYLRAVEGFSGATILGSGRVALILDPPALIEGLKMARGDFHGERQGAKRQRDKG